MKRNENLRDCARLGYFLAYTQHNILINWMDPERAEESNRGMYTFCEGGTIEQLLDYLNYMDFYDNDYADARWQGITEILDGYDADLPEDIIDCFLKFGLGVIYQEEFRRLCNRIGPHEFANMLGWDLQTFYDKSKKENFPRPIQQISQTTLWTFGQAEEYKLHLKDGPMDKSEFDTEWENRLNQIQSLEIEEYYYNDIVKEHITNIFFDSDSWPVDKKLKLAKFILSKSKVCSDAHHYLGGIYLHQGDYINAKIHLEEAKQLIEKDYESGEVKEHYLLYVFTLIQLAYAYIKLELDVTLCDDLIRKAKENSSLDQEIDDEWELNNVFYYISKGHEAFAEWFKNNIAKYEYFKSNV